MGLRRECKLGIFGIDRSAAVRKASRSTMSLCKRPKQPRQATLPRLLSDTAALPK